MFRGKRELSPKLVSVGWKPANYARIYVYDWVDNGVGYFSILNVRRKWPWRSQRYDLSFMIYRDACFDPMVWRKTKLSEKEVLNRLAYIRFTGEFPPSEGD